MRDHYAGGYSLENRNLGARDLTIGEIYVGRSYLSEGIRGREGGRIVGVIVILVRRGLAENYILCGDGVMRYNNITRQMTKNGDVEFSNLHRNGKFWLAKIQYRGVEETVPLNILFVSSGYLNRLPRYEGSK